MDLLTPRALTWGLCRQLGKRIRPEDARECELKGYTPEMAMFAGCGTTGEAFAAMHGETPIGAFGWTEAGRIWSLWANLTLAEAKCVLGQTPKWVSRMVAVSGRTYLDNWVHADNRKALAWLRASRCFGIDSCVQDIGGAAYHHIATRHDIHRRAGRSILTRSKAA